MKNPHAARALMEFTFEDTARAEAARAALAPEEEATYPDTEMMVGRKKNVLYLQIEAKDAASLRAAVNSSLRWIMIIKDVTVKGR
ncbi:MAG: KEOPS complex subunit Pcc1 [Candidatus Hadarchaeales archaeon]